MNGGWRFFLAFGLAGKYRISLGNLTTCKYLIIPIIHLTSNIKKGQFCPIFHTQIIFLLLKNLIINNIYHSKFTSVDPWIGGSFLKGKV